MERGSRARRSIARKRKKSRAQRLSVLSDTELTLIPRAHATAAPRASGHLAYVDFEDAIVETRCIDVVRRPNLGRGNHNLASDARAVCEVIVFGSGMQDSYGVMLHRVQMYGCDRRARHRDSFWAIDVDTKLFQGCGAHALSFPTYNLLAAPSKPVPPSCDVAEGSADVVRRSQEVRDQVWRFAKEHRAVAIVIDLVLSRPAVMALSDQYVLELGPTFATRPEFSCAYSALLNAVVALHGVTVGRLVLDYVKKKKPTMSFRDLKEMANRFDQVRSSLTECEMRRCPGVGQKHLEKHGGFEFLASSAKGVWVVRIAASSLSNHVVVVDCDKRVI